MLVHTLPDGTVPTMAKLPTPTPPATVHGALEEDYDVRAVVTVQIAMTRDMLAVALNLANGANDENPDHWNAQFIHESVEMALTYENVIDIERTAEGFAEFGEIDPTAKPTIQATYRAVDRAYPHLALKAVQS